MDDFFRSLTEQACGNVHKKLLKEDNPAFQTDAMGGGGIGQGMSPMGGNDMDQGMGMDNMDMPGEEEGAAQEGGIQLTGEQIAMLNQDLQGITQAIQRLQSVLGGEIKPMGGGDDMGDGQEDMNMGMGDMPNMNGMQQPSMPGSPQMMHRR